MITKDNSLAISVGKNAQAIFFRVRGALKTCVRCSLNSERCGTCTCIYTHLRILKQPHSCKENYHNHKLTQLCWFAKHLWQSVTLSTVLMSYFVGNR